MKGFRIGHGYDVHALAEGLPLIIGGVSIEYDKGFVAHSDGDVLVHAICDALLGAAALGDIGLHFPDNDERFRGADSLQLLRHCVSLLADEGYSVVNIDSTVVMQQPRLRPYIDDMRMKISGAVGISVDCVSIKATTEEKLGFTGSSLGVSAHAVALLGSMVK